MDKTCIHCDCGIRPNQHMLQCRSCLKWQHRTCRSSVIVDDYRNAQKHKQVINWQCFPCISLDNVLSNQIFNNTPVYLDGRVPEYLDINESPISEIGERNTFAFAGMLIIK